MTVPRGFLPVVAAAGGLLLLLRGLEVQASLPEIDLATPGGKIRLASLLVSKTQISLLGDLLLVVSACGAGHPRAIRLLGWVHTTAGVLLILLIPLFFLSAARIAGAAGAGLEIYRLQVIRVLLLLAGLAGLAFWAGRSLLGLAPAEPAHQPLT